MTGSGTANQVSRDAILKILSDEENARVSSAETANSLADGQDFIDLQALDRGVQRATGTTKAAMGHVLPRGVVDSETWSRVVAMLGQVAK